MRTSVAALPERDLAHAGDVTVAFRERGCRTIRNAASLVWTLPYGRNTDRADYRLVLVEGRGTCSTKHALLAALAIEQAIAIPLRLGIYEMTEANTHGVGRVLDGVGLTAIPEAHCGLRYRGVDIDLTMPPDRPGAAARTFLHEETIAPDPIGTYKAQLHERFLVRWLARQKRGDLDLADAWRIREACIAALSADPPPTNWQRMGRERFATRLQTGAPSGPGGSLLLLASARGHLARQRIAPKGMKMN